jgi:hypothetical protein
MVGLAQGAFAKAVPYTYERKQFGQPVGTFQGMQHQLARAAVDIDAARLLTYNAARRKDAGLPFAREAAAAKLYASECAQRVAGGAIEWAGGVGFTRETGIEKFWRDSKIVRAARGGVGACADVHTGRDIRGHVEHPAADDRKVHPEGVLVGRGVCGGTARIGRGACIITFACTTQGTITHLPTF